MARRKTPDDETPEEKTIRQYKEKIANAPSRSEKVSWNRKMSNLQALHEKIVPIEEEIIALMEKKQPIFDEMQEIREVMVNECIHPFDHLEFHENHIRCKFCNKKMSIPNG